VAIDNQSESNANSGERRKFMDALPFYANGTLSSEEHDWFEQYLKSNPELQKAVDWHKQMQQHVFTYETNRLAGIPETIGLKGLKERLSVTRKESTWRKWWSELSGASWLPTAFAGLLAVVVLQSIVLGTIVSKKDELGEPRAPGAISKKEAINYLQINVKSDTKERDLRLALIRVGARVVDGPGQFGDYIISVPSKRLEEAKNELTRSAYVESIKKIDQLPQRD